MTATRCRICGVQGDNARYRVREMLHGTRETFPYFECGDCGCVQITDIPADLGRFYPAGYFSFRRHDGLARNRFRRWIDPLRVRHAFGGKSAIGAIAQAVGKPLEFIDWVRRAGQDRSARVLDVGCGTGKSLICMALGGFARCQGVDPFLPETLRYPLGVTVHALTLAAFAEGRGGVFDLIMFHHSFEHLVDPLADLKTAASLLAPGGCILIEIPVAGSWAWRHYRENWCNLDAPRHLHLLTSPSMSVLAQGADLKIADAQSVGRLSQFVGSERYLRDIPANDPRSDRELFTPSQLARYRAEVAVLNDEGRGDLARFFLHKPQR